MLLTGPGDDGPAAIGGLMIQETMYTKRILSPKAVLMDMCGRIGILFANAAIFFQEESDETWNSKTI